MGLLILEANGVKMLMHEEGDYVKVTFMALSRLLAMLRERGVDVRVYRCEESEICIKQIYPIDEV